MPFLMFSGLTFYTIYKSIWAVTAGVVMLCESCTKLSVKAITVICISNVLSVNVEGFVIHGSLVRSA